MQRQDIKRQRFINKLNQELGSVVLAHLANEEIVEITLNADGKLWIEHYQDGYQDTGKSMARTQAWQLIGSLAAYANCIVDHQSPILETLLPYSTYRFTGSIPPIVTAPCFTIRKTQVEPLTLRHYVAQDSLSLSHYRIIQSAIDLRQTFLIVGGPGTGKTTFARALLDEMVQQGQPNQRLIIIEDTPELTCKAPNSLYFKTSNYTNYEQLLRTSLRQRADKICVGECRGKEILTLLKAWNTGTKGGIATLHANSARSALLRVQDLAQESGFTPSPYLLCESINFIIVLAFDSVKGRIIQEVAKVMDYQEGKYELNTY